MKSWLRLIFIIACAFVSVSVTAHFGFPYFLSFIPIIFGILAGVLLVDGLSRLACLLGSMNRPQR